MSVEIDFVAPALPHFGIQSSAFKIGSRLPMDSEAAGQTLTGFC